jgi:hypothetical protein
MPLAINIAQRASGTTFTFDRGKWSGQTQYVITEAAGQRLTASDILSDGTIADVLFPTEYGGAGGAITDQGAYWYSLITQPSFSLSMIDDGGFAWQATISFESLTGDAGTTNTDYKVEREVGFTAIEYSLAGEGVDVYRIGATAPASKATPADTDIGGTKVDSGGEPITYFNNVAKVSVRNVIAGRPTPPVGFINKRNNADFVIGPYTFPQDTLLFTGCSITRVGAATYEIVYQFVYDNGFHLRQIAKRGPDGQVIKGKKTDSCGSAPTTVPDGEVSNALCVFFRQPFKDTANFYSIGMVGI